MNWGKKIIFVFGVFAAGIGSMVYVSFSKNIDLVSENYYEQEIRYQDRIDLIKYSEHFERDVTLSNVNDLLLLTIPPAYQETAASLVVHFYRSDDAGKDLILTPDIKTDGKYDLSETKLSGGNWKVRIELKDSASRPLFFSEKILFAEN